jgi:purine-binding chemotaxis protein CheW
LSTVASSFAASLERFFYRPDEPIGPFLELTPMGRGPQVAAAEETPEEFLAFVLEGEVYAVPIEAVREIVKVTDLTEIPRAPRNVIGLLNVRGDMLPLYDVKVRLHLTREIPQVRSRADVPRAARVVLLRSPEGDAGILVDQVHGVVKLQRSRLERAPDLGFDREPIVGLGRSPEEMFIVLDVEAVLS